ncbi:hypothetical protein [Paenibacillus segetis]|uniref:TATA-box binding n=1 Tax=Paenibacillus segetis TaxID=1325360 RepID=A0ABQ1YDX5_9BACL|nr:hypothetical protein [Paenibacillus segetis]GGH22568.1 hypothetical protein GCM10008013_21080 [Paenibacillus segetis]
MSWNKRVMQFVVLLVCVLVTIGVMNLINEDTSEPSNENVLNQTQPTAVNVEKQQSSEALSLEQVKDLIRKQGIDGEDYWNGLSYLEVDLDGDNEPELVAAINGGVHLGVFYIFDKTSPGKYQLLAEKGWKVASLDFGAPIEVGEKQLFEVVEMTGGSGISVRIAHLMDIQHGELVEVWQGTLKEMNAMLGGSYYVIAGSFQVVNDILYAWQTRSELEDDAVTVKGEPITTVKMYTYDGSQFVEK